MATQAAHFIPVEEYLQQEETAVGRHEYFNGEIFVMSGGTPNNTWIAMNIAVAIHPQLKNKGCHLGGADMGIKTPQGLYTYPDVVISCKPENFDGNFLLNPVVIVEVLSDSTELYNRGKKFEKYRQIDSFREYLLVAQDRMHVEHYVRDGSLQEAIWSMREFKLASDVVSLTAVSASLPLDLIYADITLESPSASK